MRPGGSRLAINGDPAETADGGFRADPGLVDIDFDEAVPGGENWQCSFEDTSFCAEIKARMLANTLAD